MENVEENGEINVLKQEGCSLYEIARRFRGSRSIIRNYLADYRKLQKKERKGCIKTVNKREECDHFLRIVSNSTSTAREIAA